LVVSDPSNPQNEGKVFLYQYGAKIFGKLQELLNPQFEDETAADPFNMWEGANFRLKIQKVAGYPNYDKSVFDTPSAISDDDSELERIFNEEHSLKELVDPKNFKSYDDLKTKFYRVLALDQAPSTPNTAEEVDDLDMSSFGGNTPEPTLNVMPESQSAAPSMSMNDDDDDDLSIFKELANG